MKTWIPDARNFAYLTWKQVDALAARVDACWCCRRRRLSSMAIILPLATDTLINNLLLGKALALLPAELPIYALPPICYGKSNEHMGFRNAFGERANVSCGGARSGRKHCGQRVQESWFSTTRMAGILRWWMCWRAICGRSLGCEHFRCLARQGAAFEGVSAARAHVWISCRRD